MVRFISPSDVGELYFQSRDVKIGLQPEAITLDSEILDYFYVLEGREEIPISILPHLELRNSTRTLWRGCWRFRPRTSRMVCVPPSEILQPFSTFGQR